MTPTDAQARLAEIRASIEAESVSYQELSDLQALAEYIEPGDTVLLEWAGVPEGHAERVKAAAALGLTEYGYCPERDAEHDPMPATVHDRDMPPGYVTIECRACGQTTGYPMPDAERIDWG